MAKPGSVINSLRRCFCRSIELILTGIGRRQCVEKARVSISGRLATAPGQLLGATWFAHPFIRRGGEQPGESIYTGEIDRSLLQALIDDLMRLVGFSLSSQNQRFVPMRGGKRGIYLDRPIDVSRRFFDLVPREQDLSKIVLRFVIAGVEPDGRTKVFFCFA